MANDNNNRQGKKRSLTVKILINLLLMMCVAVALIWLSTVWLDSWTDHGNYAVVPELKGMSYEQAVETLRAEGLEAELSDSVYDNKVKPGIVVEQNPKVGAKIKNGRVIFLTVNAFSTRSVTLPNMTDMSLRQAQSILTGLGIKNITIEEVPSEFKNLVMAVKRDGRRLAAGARVPVTAHIVIEVGAGLPELNDSVDIVATDSLSMDHLDLM